MMKHDKFCQDAKHPHVNGETSCVYCQCALIYAVREDERLQVLGGIHD